MNKFNPKQYLSTGLSQEQIILFKQNFDKYDYEKIGTISKQIEFKDSLYQKGPQARSKGIYQLICQLDSQGYGNITFQQYLHLNMKRLVKQDTRRNINMIFKLFDDQKSGYISVRSLRRKSKQLGLQIQEQDLEDMIMILDQDKDGLVSQQEFYKFLNTVY